MIIKLVLTFRWVSYSFKFVRYGSFGRVLAANQNIRSSNPDPSFSHWLVNLQLLCNIYALQISFKIMLVVFPLHLFAFHLSKKYVNVSFSWFCENRFSSINYCILGNKEYQIKSERCVKPLSMTKKITRR